MSDAPTSPRILYVVRHIPYVPSSGAVTRSFHLVKAAARLADVTLIGMPQDRDDPRLTEMRAICREVIELDAEPGMPSGLITRTIVIVQSLSARSIVVRPLGMLLNWVRTSPLARRFTQRVESSGVRDLVARLLREPHYDLVIVEHTEIARKLSDLLEAWGGPRIADLHNVMHVHEDRMRRARGEEVPNPALSSASPVRADEEQIMRSYSLVTAVSEADAALLRPLGPVPVAVVPNGVDTEYFRATEGLRAEHDRPPALVFSGLLSYEPNVDAVLYFVREVWPAIRRREANAVFNVVGGGPVDESLAVLDGRDGIRLAVSVPDVRPFMARSRVAVVPLRLGSGTRLKILEALAAGLPVVSTSLGAEGLDLRHDRDLLIADTPEDFAQAVLALLRDPEHAAALTRHGQGTVARLYDWSGVTETFQAVLARALGATGSPSPSP